MNNSLLKELERQIKKNETRIKFASHHIPADELSKLRFSNQTFVNKKSAQVSNKKKDFLFYKVNIS